MTSGGGNPLTGRMLMPLLPGLLQLRMSATTYADGRALHVWALWGPCGEVVDY
jgi:hypothetical protein